MSCALKIQLKCSSKEVYLGEDNKSVSRGLAYVPKTGHILPFIAFTFTDYPVYLVCGFLLSPGGKVYTPRQRVDFTTVYVFLGVIDRVSEVNQNKRNCY